MFTIGTVIFILYLLGYVMMINKAHNSQQTDLENDRLEEIDLRATSALGLKYSWFDELEYQVAVRSGMAFRYEKSGSSSSNDLSDPAIDLGLEYSHIIKDSLALESDFTFVPSLNDFDEGSSLGSLESDLAVLTLADRA